MLKVKIKGKILKHLLKQIYTSMGSFTIVNIFLIVQRVLILRPPPPTSISTNNVDYFLGCPLQAHDMQGYI